MPRILARLLAPLLTVIAMPGWAAEDPAPAGWWTFDAADVSGDTVWDRAGSAHGQLGEGTRLVPGRIGQGVQIAAPTGVVQCQTAPILGQDFTIAAWFRSERLAAQQHSIYAGDVKGCHYLRINPDGQLVLGQADLRVVVGSQGKIIAGTWNHVAVTWQADGSYRFFINGSDAGTGRIGQPTPFAQARHASLGQVTGGMRRRTMDGQLDEVQVYAATLPPEAIAVLARRTTSPEATANRPPTTPALRLSAGAADSWFAAGRPVTFAVETGASVPAGLSALVGTVHDRNDAVIATISVTREQLLATGWAWTPPAPGWYDIAFVMSVDGRQLPLATSFNYQDGKGEPQVFSRDRRSVAVVAELPPGRRPQFGFKYGLTGEHEVALARHIGFGFVNFPGFTWGANGVTEADGIEVERGVYRWERTDRHLALLKQHGFTEVTAQFCYTPRWASPHPEDGKIEICTIGRHVYAPTRMEYMQEFLTAAVKRYGADIRTWEVWNEPHLPGGSVFWKDTPEAFVRLLRAAQETLKKEQPGCEVWIGGMGGKRYLPFYKTFLKLGGAPFDRLAIHGSWPEIDGFRALERQHGASSVPWLSSEWHAILLDAGQPPPSELLLARRLVLDACHHLRHGAERLVLFCLEENEDIEKEMMPTATREGRFAQSSGLFRTRPRSEPRLPAVAMRTLIGQVRERLVFAGVADLPGAVRTVWFTDAGGTLAVVWGENAAPVGLPPALAAAMAAPGVTACTSDGTPLAAAALPALAPGELIFVRDLPAAWLATLPASDQPIRPDRRIGRAGGTVVSGQRGGDPLLDAEGTLRAEARPRWNSEGWRYVPAEARERPAGLAARFALSVGGHGLDLVVEVDDPVFHQDGKLPRLWNGDSVQFAIDSDGSGAWRNQTEFLLAKRPGDTWFVKTMVPGFDGDLPQRWTPAWKQVANARVRADARAGGLRYAVHIDASELYPFAYDPEAKEPLRFSVLVNNSDGGNRGGWLEWGGGIGEAKEPELYGKLELR